MVRKAMKEKYTLTIDEQTYHRLYKHLFPGDLDEHGAVVSIGISKSEKGTRLLVRNLFLAEDGKDYIPGTRGYRALTPQFITETSDYCYRNGLGYLAIHNHRGKDYVNFSDDDLDSHERGYPALLEITGGPVGALVFAENAVAGSIWTEQGVFELEHITIVGSKIQRLYPNLPKLKTYSDPVYDRHARLFGDKGQTIIKNLKVGIIGLGGGGSLINEWLSKLGVGEIVAIDFDKVEPSNIPRIPGATRWDAAAWFSESKYAFMRVISRMLAKHKVTVARRIAKKANPKIVYHTIKGDILDEQTALLLKDADFVFLATDNIRSRNVFNTLLHQYLIPGAQIGAKVRTDPETKEIIEIFSTGRMILPYQGGGCLSCNGWIPSGRLQDELISEEERKNQRYVEDEDVREASVIMLNVLSAAQIVNDFMMMFTGLYSERLRIRHYWYDVMNRELNQAQLIHKDDCRQCSCQERSRFGYGDLRQLPCRVSGKK